jgi:hypothetical protein
LAQLPHRRLTAPIRAAAVDFHQIHGGLTTVEVALQLPVVAAGRLNTVAFWFDLHLNGDTAISSGAQ